MNKAEIEKLLSNYKSFKDTLNSSSNPKLLLEKYLLEKLNFEFDYNQEIPYLLTNFDRLRSCFDLNSNIKEYEFYAYVIADKINSILESILLITNSLQKETTSELSQKSYIDFNTVKILCRSVLESFLVFNYIFVQPKENEEKEFYFNLWYFADLMGMNKKRTFAEMSEDPDVKKLKIIQEEFENERKFKFINSKFFDLLPQKQKDAIVKRGDYKINYKWPELASKAGFNSVWFKSYYFKLSSYTHSGSYSILSDLGSTYKLKLKFLELELQTMTIIYSLFILDFVSVFPKLESHFTNFSEFKGKVCEYMDTAFLEKIKNN